MRARPLHWHSDGVLGEEGGLPETDTSDVTLLTQHRNAHSQVEELAAEREAERAAAANPRKGNVR